MAAKKKAPAEKKAAAKTKRPRKKKAGGEPGSRGLTAQEVTSAKESAAVEETIEAITRDGGEVIGTYRDPVGGHAHVIAALPIDKVAPTPFQRDLSPTHVGRLTEVID